MLGVALALPPPDRSDAAAPEQRLAGLPLLLRCVLDLQRLGATHLLLLAPPGGVELRAALAADPRVHAPIERLDIEAGAPPWGVLADRVKEPFVLLHHDLIVAAAAHRALAEPLADHLIGRLVTTGEPLTGPMRGRPELLEALAHDDLEVVAARPDVAVHALEQPEWAPVRRSGGHRRATGLLLEACRKPVDGIVSRHLNRHVSLAITRLLLPTPITPNVMTAVTFAVALVACRFALAGDYRDILIGAALMQLGSILDGCDGELARVRYQGSRLGQWLDTIGDDASNVLFWAALGVAAWGPTVVDRALAISGWVAAGGGALVAVQYYLLLAKMGSGDLYDLKAGDAQPSTGVVGKVVAFGNTVLKQDFFLLLLLALALGGLLLQALPLFAAGGLVTLASATARSWRVLVRASRPAQPKIK